MDGFLAALFLAAGLTDMGLNHCGNGGCLAQNDAQSRMSLSFGDVQFQENSIASEAYVRYELGQTRGPFQPVVGLSVTDQGSAWVGFGALWTQDLGRHAYVQLHLMPGLYAQGSGPDLGHALEIRSGAEVGYIASNGVRFGASFDHRSNAELDAINPGLETIQFRVSVPLK